MRMPVIGELFRRLLMPAREIRVNICDITFEIPGCEAADHVTDLSQVADVISFPRRRPGPSELLYPRGCLVPASPARRRDDHQGGWRTR
jgi:hypothetical protein